MRRKKRKTYLNIFKGSIDSVIFKPLLFIDLEYITTNYRTNGQRANLQEIIEVAAISITEEGCFKYNKIIKPKFYLKYNPDITVNKFSIEDVSTSISFETMVDSLKSHYTPGLTKVISWGNSDLFNINNLCRVYNVDYHIKKTDYIDLSQKFRRFYNLNQAITLEKALCFKNINDDYNKHRALPDTEMLVRLFDEMIKDGYIDEEMIKGV